MLKKMLLFIGITSGFLLPGCELIDDHINGPGNPKNPKDSIHNPKDTIIIPRDSLPIDSIVIPKDSIPIDSIITPIDTIPGDSLPSDSVRWLRRKH